MITDECKHCGKIAYLIREDTCMECKIVQEDMVLDRTIDNRIAREIDEDREGRSE